MISEWPFGVWTADMNVNVTGRLVPARPAMFRIVRRTNYMTLFGQMFSSTNQISGEITFTPQADEIYSVRGEIGKTCSAGWIADSTGTPVAPKIEVRRPAQ